MSTKLVNERHIGTRLTCKLNVQQQLFVDNLLADKTFDLTKAARAAGYKSPSVAGCRLIKQKIIAAAVGREVTLRSERLRFTADDVLNQLRTVLEADLTQLYNDEGECSMADIKALSPVLRQCISKIRTFKKFTIDDDGNKEYYNVYELEWMSKDQALQLAMRHFGMLQPEVNVTVVNADVKARIIVEMLQYTSADNKLSIVDGTVIDRMANEA